MNWIMSPPEYVVPLIRDYDHVGIRVSDKAEALHFYDRLGFELAAEFPEYSACELRSRGGVYLNLVFNAVRRPGRKNILLDEAVKLPGTTHPCFVVDDLDAMIRWLQAESIAITEGPTVFERRRFLFIRDPDGNVLEFMQSANEGESHAPV
jgi:catechol 2,3-dioxygenase-like lactoylglutathione lyase family enzyme